MLCIKACEVFRHCKVLGDHISTQVPKMHTIKHVKPIKHAASSSCDLVPHESRHHRWELFVGKYFAFITDQLCSTVSAARQVLALAASWPSVEGRLACCSISHARTSLSLSLLVLEYAAWICVRTPQGGETQISSWDKVFYVSRPVIKASGVGVPPEMHRSFL